MNKHECHNLYAPVVNEFFDMAPDPARSGEVIPFLASLSPADKRLVAKAVADYDCAVDINTDDRREAFGYARYFCFDREQIKNVEWNWYNFPNVHKIDGLLDLYIPEWFADYLPDNPLEFNPEYKQILKWRRLGLVRNASPDRLASGVSWLFKFNNPGDNKPSDIRAYIEGWIEKYPEILEDMKYLFRRSAAAYFTDAQEDFRKQLGMGPLAYIFKTYSEKGIYDRKWILKEAVLASGRNDINKDYVYWYPGLFKSMEPDRDELLLLQPELFEALASRHVQIPVTYLKYIGTIIGDDSFLADDFINQLPTMLSSGIKGIVNAALPLVEDLLKTYPEKRDTVAEQLAVVFIHKDEAWQVKAAKWIRKYAGMEAMRPVLEPYRGTLLASALGILGDYLPEGESTAALQTTEPAESRDRPVDAVGSVEELTFRLCEAFETFRYDSADLVPDALIRFNSRIDETNIGKFGPAIKAAGKVLGKDLRGKHYTDDILAFSFLHYCVGKLDKLPQDDAAVRRLKRNTGALMEELFGREGESKPARNPVLDELFKSKMDIMRQFLATTGEDADLPLLSTPTHEPCWIDIGTFFDRLAIHAGKAGTGLESHLLRSYDFHTAIQRLDLRQAPQWLEKIKSEDFLPEILKEAFEYLFDPGRPFPGHGSHPGLFMACTFPRHGREIPRRLADNHYPGMPASLLTGKFDWKITKVPVYRQLVGKNTHVYKFIDVPRLEPDYAGYFPEEYKSYQFAIDMPHLLRMSPNNPEVLLGRYVFEHVQYFDKDYDRRLLPVLDFLRDCNRPVLPMGSLYLAMCLVQESKTTRSYAAEIWHSLTSAGQADQQETGRALGKLISGGVAPMKRLTDNIREVMLNRSPRHNLCLEQLVVALLAEMDEKPVPYLKILLEIYKEVLSRNRSTVPPELLRLFDKWKGGGMKKLINEISGA